MNQADSEIDPLLKSKNYFDNKMAKVFVGISCSGKQAERDELISQLEDKGFPVIDMTMNELAKDHIRHMARGMRQRNWGKGFIAFNFLKDRGLC